MKFSLIAVIASGAAAVKLENEYAIWHSVAPPPPIWNVVKRGARSFQDMNVEMAMKANEANAGTWPVADAPNWNQKDFIEPKPQYEKQNWELVVKKGNSAFNDEQVTNALIKKKEIQLINGEQEKATG